MLSVLMLFLLPVGGGIPAGVLLARDLGLSWPLTAILYLFSDIVLAVSFEPVLRFFVFLGRKSPRLSRFAVTMKAMAAKNTAMIGAHDHANPFVLVMISFGVDPMTGRSAALASGYGFILGWVFAIAGDMLYYAVVAISTLRLNAYFHDPNTAMLIVLSAMIMLPILARRVRAQFRNSLM